MPCFYCSNSQVRHDGSNTNASSVTCVSAEVPEKPWGGPRGAATVSAGSAPMLRRTLPSVTPWKYTCVFMREILFLWTLQFRECVITMRCGRINRKLNFYLAKKYLTGAQPYHRWSPQLLNKRWLRGREQPRGYETPLWLRSHTSILCASQWLAQVSFLTFWTVLQRASFLQKSQNALPGFTWLLNLVTMQHALWANEEDLFIKKLTVP